MALIASQPYRYQCIIYLNLVNSQSIATANPHVQSIVIPQSTITQYCPNLSSIPSTSLVYYVKFYEQVTGQFIPSWYSGFFGTVHVWWVRLGTAINANTTYPIQLIVYSEPVVDGTTVGVNAYYSYAVLGLSTSQAIAYDNGRNVFWGYMNFMGPSPIPSNYQTFVTNTVISFEYQSPPTPSYMQTYITPSSGWGISLLLVSAPIMQLPVLVEGVSYYNGSADYQGLTYGGGWNFIQYSNEPLTCNCGGQYTILNPDIATSCDPYCNCLSILYSEYHGTSYIIGKTFHNMLNTSGLAYNFIQSAVDTSSNVYFTVYWVTGTAIPSPTIDTAVVQSYARLVTSVSANLGTTIVLTGNYFGITESGGHHTGRWWWVRVRDYPPNGTMPAVTAVSGAVCLGPILVGPTSVA